MPRKYHAIRQWDEGVSDGFNEAGADAPEIPTWRQAVTNAFERLQ